MKQKMYKYKQIVEAKLFIDDHYADPINLNQIADSAHYSKFHFIRLFKLAFGKSPHQYLREVRIHNACRLLIQGMTVTEACYEVGFDSVPSFTHLFKKCMGSSPQRFKLKQKRKLEMVEKKPFQFIPNCFIQNHRLKNSNFQ